MTGGGGGVCCCPKRFHNARKRECAQIAIQKKKKKRSKSHPTSRAFSYDTYVFLFFRVIKDKVKRYKRRSPRRVSQSSLLLELLLFQKYVMSPLQECDFNYHSYIPKIVNDFETSQTL